MGIWVKSIWEFFTYLQLFCESEIMKTLKVKKKKKEKEEMRIFTEVHQELAARNGKQTYSDLNK